MKTSESIDELAVALAAFSLKVKNPVADQVAKTDKYSYAYPDFAAVVDAERPLLAEHGLCVVQTMAMQGDLVGAATMIVHESGQYILLDPAFLPAGGSAQEFGGAMSYSRRYSYFAALNIVASEDHAQAPAAARKAGTGKSTDAQQKKIHVEAKQAGIQDAVLAGVMQKRYGAQSTKDLTKEQASDLIERLIAEKEKREALRAAGTDPDTGEVKDSEDYWPQDEEAPGMDAEAARKSWQKPEPSQGELS